MEEVAEKRRFRMSNVDLGVFFEWYSHILASGGLEWHVETQP